MCRRWWGWSRGNRALRRSGTSSAGEPHTDRLQSSNTWSPGAQGAPMSQSSELISPPWSVLTATKASFCRKLQLKVKLDENAVRPNFWLPEYNDVLSISLNCELNSITEIKSIQLHLTDSLWRCRFCSNPFEANFIGHLVNIAVSMKVNNSQTMCSGFWTWGRTADFNPKQQDNREKLGRFHKKQC